MKLFFSFPSEKKKNQRHLSDLFLSKASKLICICERLKSLFSLLVNGCNGLVVVISTMLLAWNIFTLESKCSMVLHIVSAPLLCLRKMELHAGLAVTSQYSTTASLFLGYFGVWVCSGHVQLATRFGVCVSGCSFLHGGFKSRSI